MTKLKATVISQVTITGLISCDIQAGLDDASVLAKELNTTVSLKWNEETIPIGPNTNRVVYKGITFTMRPRWEAGA